VSGGSPVRRGTGRPRRGGPRGSGDGPRVVGESLDAAVGRLGGPDAAVLGAVFARWEELVGARAAAHVHPVSLRDGVLVVAADHPAWATQMRSSQAVVLARIAELAGRAPDRMEAVVRRP
jgi:predicted nucleic acid-binding Zn ribbon protein